MHRTPTGDRRQALQKEARELARDSRALQKVALAPTALQEGQRLQGEAEGLLSGHRTDGGTKKLVVLLANKYK